MPQSTAEIQNYLDENAERFQNELCDWLRLASVSTDSKFAGDVRAAADWLLTRFQNLGFESQIIETVGHPIVYAETPPVADAPVVLVYGHYDVQPPDPLDLWDAPPFEPTIRNGNVYARGATDDKGQLLTHVLSCEGWMKTAGKLPLQIKFLVEGEEECGSEGLNEFLAGKYDGDGPRVEDRLAADICVISDCSQYGPGQPAITYGLRGITYFELRVNGPNRDLHSGSFGGAVTNPANALSKILSGLIDGDGRIQIPGFYDDVIDLTPRERKEYESLNFDEAAYQQDLGVAATTGESGYTTLERRWARPTFDVNGLWSGYQGEGAKTVLPAKAGAKFSFRLVPNQDPVKIAEGLRQRITELCPPGVNFELVDMHGAPGALVPLENPFMEPAAKAIEKGFGTRPVFIRGGGSIPLVGSIKQQLGMDTLLLGWGQDDDNPHSPNEKFSLEDFQKGIKASAWLWQEISQINKSS
ncbi:MAG: dipeptidase [Planctomycetaceae bacterium]|nr:dipeptidase [Planctomycetaceae bacterium]MCP4463359.1 dipeptidase [Planctomycetaceae bacterium]MDG1807166.1 dipeptidase [Pirellulaceae bacterium]MDG2104968.1 dipeptidase [Pirellulaceae bacterium]